MNVIFNERLSIVDPEWVPTSTGEAIANVEALLACLSYFRFHTELVIYYSGSGVHLLLENLGLLDSMAEYALSDPIIQIKVLLNQLEAINWDSAPMQRSDCLYHYVANVGATTHNVTGSSIAEATEYCFQGGKVALLNLISSDFNGTNPINIARAEINPPKRMTLESLSILTSKNDSNLYIVQNRMKRVYNWNQKHGENGVGVIGNRNFVSPLEGTREEAEALLDIAVGYKGTDELYCFDSPRNKFMIFKRECTPNNTYHSYHPINQNEVPMEVQKFFTS